ncbi:MAG: hypothetical protein WA005_17545 [Candidatus Binataceae bacterium]
MKIRKLFCCVLAAAFAGSVMTPVEAMAANTFSDANITGTYVSEFEADLNDSASGSAFGAPSAGLQAAVHELGVDFGTHGKCSSSLTFPTGVSESEAAAVLKGLVFGPDSKMSGVMQITYDGAGSLVGEGDFNVFYDGPFTETKDIQVFNPTATGFTTRICGGPKAASEDARCKLECTGTLPGTKSPYNCANQWLGTTSNSSCTGAGAPYACCTGAGNGTCLNPGGGGYVTSTEAVQTATLPFANDSGSSAVIHFYISAFGICGSANSFAECCNDPKVDIVSHVEFANLPRTTSPVTESFGVFGDLWASGTVHSKLAQ